MISGEYLHTLTPWEMDSNKRFWFIVLVVMMTRFVPVTAQEPRITLSLDSVSLAAVVDTLEDISGVRIFLQEDHAGLILQHVQASSQPLDRFLEEVLKGTGLHLSQYDGKFFLMERNRLGTDFRKNYLSLLESRKPVLVSWTRNKPETGDHPVPREEDKYRMIRIGNPAEAERGKYAILTGTVRIGKTGQPFPDVVIYVPAIRYGTTTDNQGHYSVRLPKGQQGVEYRSIGMKTEKRNLILYSGGILDIDMYEQVNQLEEVSVSANRENNVLNMRMGIEKISMRMLKQIPMGLGEVDVVKSTLLLPGVQTVGEASAGFNVRGGNSDANLILLDGAPIINSAHFFGFFSAFQSDMIDDVTLYKSGVPARYGGRLSSVMDISLKPGNHEKIKFSGGISPVTGRVVINGPVGSRVDFRAGVRSTFSNWILRQLKDKQLQKSSAGFYDAQLAVNIDLGKNDKLSLSGYISNDRFDYYRESAFEYGNRAFTARWKHTFHPGLSAEFSFIHSGYNYRVDQVQDSTFRSSLYYTLDQNLLRADFSWIPGGDHKFTFGINTTYYDLLPGKQLPLDDQSLAVPKTLKFEQGLESALYFDDEWNLGARLTVTAGVRLNLYGSLGPATEFRYADGLPKSPESITDTVLWKKGAFTSLYPGLEYRLMSRFLIWPGFSIKTGMQRMYQYIHMISNTASISPTDIWKLSNTYIRPAVSDQFSFGLYKNLNKNRMEASAEVYYKFIGNIIDYKNGAQLLMNEHLETDLLNGRGQAYGVELMLRKNSGRLTGWVSYTYARILHRVNGDFAVEQVNNGAYFPANYDKPHDVKVVVNAKLSRRFNVTSNFMYSTGRPITFPAGYYRFGNIDRIFYTNRNEFRIPDYIRLDLAATLNGNLKRNKLNHSSWTLAAYNVLGRRNPYSIYFKVEDGEMKGYKLSIFGQPIITLTYNFRILGNALGDF